MSKESQEKLILYRRSPKPLQSDALRCVAQLLYHLNDKELDSTFPWLVDEHNPFFGIPNDVIEEIVEDFKQLLRSPVQSNVLQILMCKRVKKINLTSMKIRAGDVLPLLRMLKSVQSDLTWLEVGVINIEEEPIHWSDIPLALGYLNDYLRCLPSLTYLNVTYACNDEMLEIIGASCPNLIVLVAISESITSRGLRALCVNVKNPEDKSRRCQNIQKIILKPWDEDIHLIEGVRSLLTLLPQLHVLDWSPVLLGVVLAGLYDKAKEAPKLNLHALEYNGSFLYPSLPSALSKLCPSLLNLKIVNASKEELQRFAYMDSLRSVLIAGTELLRHFNDGVASFLKTVGKSLEVLTLACFEEIDFNVIGESCPNLRKFQCSTFKPFSGIVSPPVVAFKHLEYLSLNSAQGSGLDTNDCVGLLAKCSRLRSLYVDCCDGLNRDHLREILSKNPLIHLRKVYISSGDLHLKGTLSDWRMMCNL